MSARAGFTLLELAVTLALLTVVFSTAVLSLASLLGEADASTDRFVELVASGRSQAIESGVPVVVLVEDSAGLVDPLLLLPDGRAVGKRVDPVVGVAEIR